MRLITDTEAQQNIAEVIIYIKKKPQDFTREIIELKKLIEKIKTKKA